MTFPHDLVGREACRAGLMPLCDSVGARLRAHGVKCRTVTLQIKDPSLKVISRQKTLPYPTSLTKQLFQESCALLAQCWPENAPVRLMTVTAGSLVSAEDHLPVQLSFLDDRAPDDPRQARLEAAVDRLRSRFGKDAVRPGTPEIR